MSDACTPEGLEAPLNYIASFVEFITTQCLLDGGPINLKSILAGSSQVAP